MDNLRKLGGFGFIKILIRKRNRKSKCSKMKLLRRRRKKKINRKSRRVKQVLDIKRKRMFTDLKRFFRIKNSPNRTREIFPFFDRGIKSH